jgi:hypothetical protein
MEINSLNAFLTSTDVEKARRWDAHASELEIISAGGALVVLARGESAVDVFNALRPPSSARCNSSRSRSRSLLGRRR